MKDLDIKLDQMKKDNPNKVLRYIAEFRNNKAIVKKTFVDSNHPFYNLNGSDNIVSFHTNKYTNPIIIRGPGAGFEVTADGVLNDILHIKLN